MQQRDNQPSLCPICRAPVNTSELKPNGTLRGAAEGLKLFHPALVKLLDAAQRLTGPTSATDVVALAPLSAPPHDGGPRLSPGKKRPRVQSPQAVKIQIGSASRPHRDAAINGDVCEESILISSDSGCEEDERDSTLHPNSVGRVEGRGASESKSDRVGDDTGRRVSAKEEDIPSVPPESPPIPPGFSRCPVCEITIPFQIIHSHIDSCIQRREQREPALGSHRRRSGTPAAGSVCPRQQGAGPGDSSGLCDSGQAPARPAARNSTSAPPPPPTTTSTRPTIAIMNGPSPAAAISSDIWIPPKLVFEVMSSKELKARIVAVGLPADGKKQVC